MEAKTRGDSKRYALTLGEVHKDGPNSHEVGIILGMNFLGLDKVCID